MSSTLVEKVWTAKNGVALAVVLGVSLTTMQEQRQHGEHDDDKPAAHDRVEAEGVRAYPGRMQTDVIHPGRHMRAHAVLLAGGNGRINCPEPNLWASSVTKRRIGGGAALVPSPGGLRGQYRRFRLST